MRFFSKGNFIRRQIVVVVLCGLAVLLSSAAWPAAHGGAALLKQFPDPADPASFPADYAPTVLITGSNRGIGFEFAKQYAERGWQVIATARKPETADALQALAWSYADTGQYAPAVAILFELSQAHPSMRLAYESLKRLYASRSGGEAPPR